MRQTVIVPICLLLALLLNGCGNSSEADMDKLELGMSLEEVESILGKGTAYADVNSAKAELGFSIDDPELQRNTYVWVRDDGTVIVTFVEGKLARSLFKFPSED